MKFFEILVKCIQFYLEKWKVSHCNEIPVHFHVMLWASIECRPIDPLWKRLDPPGLCHSPKAVTSSGPLELRPPVSPCRNGVMCVLQVDLGVPKMVRGVITQGARGLEGSTSAENRAFVRKYKLAHSLNGKDWSYIPDSKTGFAKVKRPSSSSQTQHPSDVSPVPLLLSYSLYLNFLMVEAVFQRQTGSKFCLITSPPASVSVSLHPELSLSLIHSFAHHPFVSQGC